MPITLVPSGLGTSSQTSFLLNCSNSSCIALIQNSSVSASFTFLGSILETKHELETISISLDLVVTPLFGSPIISSLGCIFWILMEGLLSGWLMFESSVAGSEFSAFSPLLAASATLSPDVLTSSSTSFFLAGVRSSTTTLMDSITVLVLELNTLYALLFVEYPRNIPASLLGSIFLLCSLSAKM